MANTKGNRRRFGAVRKLPSGRWQARYPDTDGILRAADRTFASKRDAEQWLNETETDMRRGEWVDPRAGEVEFEAYALKWIEERGLRPTTDELYRRLYRLHLRPTFGSLVLSEITPPRVRSWRAERLAAGAGSVAVAKSYRLLRAILNTAVDDEVIRRNPCRIKGAGKENSAERPVATIEQVYALADAVGPRWRTMVLLGAFATLRPEEQAELRREDVDLEAGTIRVRLASPELTTGRRVTGDPKSQAGKRTIVLPELVVPELRRHIEWFAQKEPNGLLFVGPKGGLFRRSSFGRIWRRARVQVGMPEGFRFYDLRHTGNTLAAATGASLKELMARMGQSSARAALIYQHATRERDEKIAKGVNDALREVRRKAHAKKVDATSGTDLARDA